jgi:transposase-like protein
MKRKFALPNLDAFQAKLEDFFQKVVRQKEDERQDIEAYKRLVYEYHQKGMSLRDIAKATEIPRSTVGFWVKQMRKIPPTTATVEIPAPLAHGD